MSDSQDKDHSIDSRVETVLVVEDDHDVGEFFVQALLQETPYEALLAPDGLRALEIMKSIKPNIIVLDYTLPQMNGIEFYDRLKAIKELADIPVLLVSARVPTKEAQQRKIPYLKKPVELEELLRSIEQLLG